MSSADNNGSLTTNMNSPSPRSMSPRNSLQLPSPIITRRTRTHSTCERALQNPIAHGTIKQFCRERGHGFLVPTEGGDAIFVHVSDVEGEFVPLPGDEVTYRLCAIPPKFEKYQAIHVQIVNFSPEVHQRWDTRRGL